MNGIIKTIPSSEMVANLSDDVSLQMKKNKNTWRRN